MTSGRSRDVNHRNKTCQIDLALSQKHAIYTPISLTRMKQHYINNGKPAANIFSWSSSNQASSLMTYVSSKYTLPDDHVQGSKIRPSSSNDHVFRKATKSRKRLFNGEPNKTNDINKYRQQICYQKGNCRRVHSNQMPELLGENSSNDPMIKPSLVLEYILKSREVEMKKPTGKQHLERCQSAPEETTRVRKTNEEIRQASREICHELRDILSRRPISTASVVNSKSQNLLREEMRLPASSKKRVDFSSSNTNSILKKSKNHIKVRESVDMKNTMDGNWILKPNHKLTPLKADKNEKTRKVGMEDDNKNKNGPHQTRITDITNRRNETGLLQNGKEKKKCVKDLNIPFDRNCKLRKPIFNYPILRERNDLFWSRYFTNSSLRPHENWSFGGKRLVENNPYFGMFRLPSETKQSFPEQKLSSGTSVFGYFNRCCRCQSESHHYEEIGCKRVPRKCKILLKGDSSRPKIAGGKNDRYLGQKGDHAPDVPVRAARVQHRVVDWFVPGFGSPFDERARKKGRRQALIKSLLLFIVLSVFGGLVYGVIYSVKMRQL